MNPDQVPPFPTRGSISRFVDTPMPQRTTSDFTSRTWTDSPANSAGFQSSQVPLQTALRHDYSTTDAHFFSTPAVQTPPANSAGEDVLARSSTHATVNWLSPMPPLDRARTEAQNASRTDGGSTDTFEARTLEIMQYIWDLSDNHDRLQAMASSLQPFPEDHDQRLSQLYTSVRSIIDELRQDCTQYTLAMGDWDILNTEHLSEDNEWSRLMLECRRTFFEDPAFISKQLDEKQMDLLAYYYQLQHRIEDILLEREAATATTNLRSRAANSAAGYPDLSVIQQQCANLRLGTQPATDDFGQSRSTGTGARRSQNVFGEPLPPPIPMGWSAARGGSRKNPQRPTANSAAGTAPSLGLAANSAACHLGGRGFNATVTSGPPQDHTKTMMSSFTSSAAEKKPNIASSGILQVGADGKPFNAGTTDLKQLPTTRYANLMADAEVRVAKCPLCSGPHWPSQCSLYDTATKRIRRAMQLHFCLLCLRGGHRADMCPKKSGVPCRHCSRGEHHLALCKDLHRRRTELGLDPMRAKKKEQATPTVTDGTPSAASPKDDPGIPSRPPRPVHQSWTTVNWLKPNPHGGSTVDNRRFASAPSSEPGRSNSTVREKKPSRKDRTDLEGLRGTRDPPAEIAHESLKTKDAHASGTAEPLLTQKSLRTTDRSSHQDEMMQFDRTHGGGSGNRAHGCSTDDTWRHKLHAEDNSPTQPSGSLTDDTLGVPVTEPTHRFTTRYKGETEATAPLVECLLATIKNPWTDDSCAAVVAFDRQRHASLITKELVYALKLPAA